MNETPLCIKCKFFNPKDRTLNCPTANSIIEFCKNHKVDLFIIGCKEFKKKVSFEVVQYKEKITGGD